jgi:hypothetical protein
MQFVGRPNLNLVFEKLIKGEPIPIKYVTDPPTDSYEIQRPNVKNHAKFLGVDINTEFPTDNNTASTHKPKLQALHYPADLAKFCQKLRSGAHAIIQETGTNILYLVFGFLEFYEEKNNTAQKMIAPLLAIPVALKKGAIDPQTRTHEYHVLYSGEDIHENQTLKEKLSKDFFLQLPDFGKDDAPYAYFARIQNAVRNQKDWRVRHQLTLGFLSFGKHAIWDDLDPNKWPSLLEHELLRAIFSGNAGFDSSQILKDYKIDELPPEGQHLIYDADSSQHSAIIDVLDGKNIVINGPPGTGKSQTITNIIAAGLKAGKKILFVSEKLAALEVVRRRLNQANLGHFCLELHSHKTQKKKLLSEIQERLDEKFEHPQQYKTKLGTLTRQKLELNKHAELMATCLGNKLGMSVYEIFWRTECKRQAVSKWVQAIQLPILNKAQDWTENEIASKRSKLDSIGKLFDSLGTFGIDHPWWGFEPKSLLSGDDVAIKQTVSEAEKHAELLTDEVEKIKTLFGLAKEPSLKRVIQLADSISAIPNPPNNIQADIFPKVFTHQDPLGERNLNELFGVIRKVRKAIELNTKADDLLNPASKLTYDDAEPVVRSCRAALLPDAFATPIDSLAPYVNKAESAHDQFKRISTQINFSFTHDLSSVADEPLAKLQNSKYPI